MSETVFQPISQVCTEQTNRNKTKPYMQQ